MIHLIVDLDHVMKNDISENQIIFSMVHLNQTMKLPVHNQHLIQFLVVDQIVSLIVDLHQSIDNNLSRKNK
jgi:hypothetical protein